MEEILISIIIPVYNVEKYVDECIKSILEGNRLDQIEILLIDDGSTDSSGSICDNYSSEKVKVYHKINGGLSDARNYGLLRANGKYVFFVDSDDIISPGAINKLYELIKKEDVDVVLWDAIIIEEDGEISQNQDDEYYVHHGLKKMSHYTGIEIIEKQLKKNDDYVTTVWSGLYRKELILSEHIWFEKGLLHEDELWTQKVFICAKDIFYLKEQIYFYRKRTNSIMNQVEKNFEKNIQSLIYIYSTLPIYLDWKLDDKQFIKKMKGNIAKRYLHMIFKYNVSNYPSLSKRINKMEILKDAGNSIDKLRALILIININLYCWTMKKIR